MEKAGDAADELATPSPPKSKTHHVFVYGTLKDMHKRRFTGAKLLGEGETVEAFILFDGGYPLAIKTSDPEAEDFGKAHAKIAGQLFEVPEDTLIGLDNYEGYPDFYTRSQTTIKLEDGLEFTAWMYHGEQAKRSIDHRAVMIPDENGRVSWSNAADRNY